MFRARTFVAVSLVAPLVLGLSPLVAGAATAKVGAVCSKPGASSGTLSCAKKAGRLVWSKTATAASSSASLAGTWKPTAASKVGYRAKEVLFGQDAVTTGQTNAVTGSLTITGTAVTAVVLSADLTKLASDEAKRDAQVQGRILETAKFPTATLKLMKPIDFGKAPAEGMAVSQKGSVELTLHGVTKTVDVDLSARLKSGNIEVSGSVPLTWADWGVSDPSFAGQITVEPRGQMEFLVVFAK